MIDPLSIAGAISQVLPLIPSGGGKRRKFASGIIRASEIQVGLMAEKFDALAKAGESLTPGALSMASLMLTQHAAHLDAAADVLTGEDDEQP